MPPSCCGSAKLLLETCSTKKSSRLLESSYGDLWSLYHTRRGSKYSNVEVLIRSQILFLPWLLEPSTIILSVLNPLEYKTARTRRNDRRSADGLSPALPSISYTAFSRVLVNEVTQDTLSLPVVADFRD